MGIGDGVYVLLSAGDKVDMLVVDGGLTGVVGAFVTCAVGGGKGWFQALHHHLQVCFLA